MESDILEHLYLEGMKWFSNKDDQISRSLSVGTIRELPVTESIIKSVIRRNGLSILPNLNELVASYKDLELDDKDIRIIEGLRAFISMGRFLEACYSKQITRDLFHQDEYRKWLIIHENLPLIKEIIDAEISLGDKELIYPLKKDEAGKIIIPKNTNRLVDVLAMYTTLDELESKMLFNPVDRLLSPNKRLVLTSKS